MLALAVLAGVVASAYSYQIGDSPTLPPIAWEYQIESFVTYLVSSVEVIDDRSV